ncbi:MAG: YhfG family protein [Telluria sp.]
MGVKTKMRRLKLLRAKELVELVRLRQIQDALTHFKAMDDFSTIERQTKQWREFQEHIAVSNALEIHRQTSAINSAMREIEKAKAFQQNLERATTLQRELENAANSQRHLEKPNVRDVETVIAFEREFGSLTAFHRHLEKASAFQKELDQATALKSAIDVIPRVADEMKRKVFVEMRDENYRASLRLEGLHPGQTTSLTTLAALKAKYVR